MNIKVNEQTEVFYLAFDEWTKATGHRISVGEYDFCAIPSHGGLNISEIKTGCKMFDIPESQLTLMVIATKEGTLEYLKAVGQSLERIIKKTKDFDSQLESLKALYEKRLGKRPPIEKAYTDWIFADEGSLKH